VSDFDGVFVDGPSHRRFCRVQPLQGGPLQSQILVVLGTSPRESNARAGIRNESDLHAVFLALAASTVAPQFMQGGPLQSQILVVLGISPRESSARAGIRNESDLHAVFLALAASTVAP